MGNNNIKKILILLLFTFLLIGIVNATEISTNTTTNQDTSTATEIIKDSTLKEADHNLLESDKTIHKQNAINKTTKASSQTINVNNFQTLHDTLTDYTSDTLTLNFKSNIKLTSDTKIDEYISKITINGNGKTVYGKNYHQFLDIPEYTTVIIKNLKIINCKSDYGGAIYNNGTLYVQNCKFYNNKATTSGGALYNTDTMTIKSSILHDNEAKYGGAVLNYENLVITDSKIYSNRADEGGAIDNEDTLKIRNSQINNNKAKKGALYNYGTLTITNSRFNNNKASTAGWAIYEDSHNIANNIKIYSKFTNNSAPRGGAIYIYSNAKNIRINSNFTQNHATYGGAIYNYRTDNVIIKGNFNYNHAKNDYNFIKDTGSNTVIVCNPSKYKFGSNGGSIYNNQGSNLKINIKSAQKKFNAINYKMVTMYMKSPNSNWPIKYINGDPFVVHYNKVGGQYDAGAYAEIDTRITNKVPVNKIIKTTVYYKNYYGQVITRSGSKYYQTSCFRASIPKGYTPYKVDIYYTKMTQRERNSYW